MSTKLAYQNTNSSASSTKTPGKTFVVPLFLSTSRYSARESAFASGALPHNTRSRSSVRSVIEHGPGRPGQVPLLLRQQREQDEVSDMYGGSLSDRTTGGHPDAHNLGNSRSISSSRRARSTQSGSTRSTHSSARTGVRPASRRKPSSRDVEISTKARMSFAFGITLLVSVVIYLVLTFRKIAQGTMFNVMSIVLILILTGIFLHQFISMLMLKRRPRRKRQRAVHRHGRERSNAQSRRAGPEDELQPEKPIPIHMAADGLGPDLERGDQVPIKIPPPVYGNDRTSMRINPDLIHWKEVLPSPLTPTYDEALNQVHQTMGYRPPSYLSENEVDEVMANRRRDVDAALKIIHPLERERLRELTAHALEGHR
ncbi:hypothetical protein EDD36DRAFT_467301 [Exophiala viscosa]|uniref:Uncharacterized protein n=1 Tax=Exophiala viscosa TaxID=2486360 RepID=A0AAN6DQK5_9EURO|nr:hypothetical protein EDD36DRAFT_467301 [Exophiala viscosa]